MKKIQIVGANAILGLLSLLIISCCDCERDLPSDEEIRALLVGRWESDDCDYPYNSGEASAAQGNHPINYRDFIFYPDGAVVEPYGGTCVRDSCDTISIVPEYCTCSLLIEDGTFTIVSEGFAPPFWFNLPIPIYCIDNDVLVLDNVYYNGVINHRVCFTRQ